MKVEFIFEFVIINDIFHFSVIYRIFGWTIGGVNFAKINAKIYINIRFIYYVI